MEIVGGGKLHVYPLSDEAPHPHGPETDWQESFVLHFWDMKTSAGAYIRIGHEPNYNGGTMCIFSNIVSPDGIFHRVENLPIGAGDVFDGGIRCAGDALRYEFDGKRIKWLINEPGVVAELEIEDFHEAIDGYPKSGPVSEFAAKHVEVACRVTGTITTHGNTYNVDGLGIRDHGWGARAWNTMVSHRWAVGVFDRENSFCAISIHTTQDVFTKFGWVIRGDKVLRAEDVDIVTFVEADGASNRGGIVRMTLGSGEIFEARFDSVAPCVTSWIHDYVNIDNFCRVTWGDRIGVGDFETSTNPLRGKHVPRVYDANTIDTNGWHPSAQAKR